MFVYRLDGVTVVISPPTLSLIFPKSGDNFSVLDELALKHYLMLQLSMAENNIQYVVFQQDPLHEWCHPPENSSRYKALYDYKLFSVPIPGIGDNSHYHFHARGTNPRVDIFNFLEVIATMTEEGALCYLSLKDLADLKQKYLNYTNVYSLERYSEAIAAKAVQIACSSDSDHYYQSTEARQLRGLRRIVEENINLKNPQFDRLSQAIEQLPDDQLKALGRTTLAGINQSVPNDGPANEFCEWMTNTTPAPASRKDIRLTNKNLFLFCFALSASMQGLDVFEDAKPYQNANLLLFLLTATAYLLRWGDQEPRHIFKSISTLFQPRPQRDEPVIQAEAHPLGLW